MSSWTGNQSIATKRARMQKLADRTLLTNLPTLEEVFSNTEPLEKDIALDIVDKIYFCRFPGAKNGGAAAIRSFLTNDQNAVILKESGTVGAIIESLYRTNIKECVIDEHMENLILSLSILAMGDINVQNRMLANAHTLPILLALCKVTKGEMHEIIFKLIDELSYRNGGMEALIELNVLKLLFSSFLARFSLSENRR